ncbi:MAG: hypothetical protein JNN18_04240 [Rubrivivax sp.]|nr:hypothetical protein [Rubrivivax sp.]
MLPSLLLTMLLAAQAQAQSPTAPRPDPLDPKAQVPALRYESSFAQVRRAGDDKPLAWREANDAVAGIGGWRVYAREAQQPDPAAANKPAAPTQAPAPSPAPAALSTPTGPSSHKH